MSGSTMPPLVDITKAMEGCSGLSIRRVRRVRYVFEGEVSSIDDGPLELTWSSGRILLFDAGANGANLTVRDGSWYDPFSEPLSGENRAWVAQYGKWTAFDVSREPPYDSLIGETARSFQTVYWSLIDDIERVSIHFGFWLKIEVGADDLRVSFSEERDAQGDRPGFG